MARPNVSKSQILDSIRKGQGAWVNMNSILDDSSFSEVSVRASVKQLLLSDTIEVNKENKPYSYRLKETT